MSVMPQDELEQALKDLATEEQSYLNPRTLRDLRSRLEAYADDPDCRTILEALEALVAERPTAA